MALHSWLCSPPSLRPWSACHCGRANPLLNSCGWYHVVCPVRCLPAFAQHVSEIHSCCMMSSFFPSIANRCMVTPQCIYPFVYWWTLGLLPVVCLFVIISKSPMNVNIQVFVSKHVFTSIWLIFRNGGQPGWLSGLAPPSVQVVTPRSWDRVPRWAPCMEPASPSACVSDSLSVSVSLMNK